MTTALDTSVLVALWDSDSACSLPARTALDAALDRGSLVISAPVFAELLAAPGRTEAFLNSFVFDTGLAVEWELSEAVWRVAGRAFQTHAARRRVSREPGPRRILADFVIGAHAAQNKYSLLTLDDRFYRKTFPDLRIVTF